MQLPFIDPAGFVSLPLGEWHYVPALQNKAGELNALKLASPDTWMRMTPLIQFVGPKDQQDPLTATSVASWAKKVFDAVADHTIFVDVLRLSPTRPTVRNELSIPVFECLLNELRKRGAAAIPVLGISATSECISLVRDAALQDGRGLAIRYPLFGTVSEGASPAERIEKLVASAESMHEEVDLMLDLGWISPDSIVDAQDVAEFLGNIFSLGQFRNIVLLGTSIPASLGVVAEGTIGSLERVEWLLWSSLRNLGGTACFGDYAIQHPKPPVDKGGPGMRANIRYTHDDGTLVARGLGPVIQEGAEQYRDLCRWLSGRAEFAGEHFSWGDSAIAACASGEGDVGSQNLWRGAGTSHHLAHVALQLKLKAMASPGV